MPLHIESPFLESLPLSRAARRRVFVKLDALQPAGSFKIRGIGHACEIHARLGAQQFISSSGGNAGLAVAYAGRQLGVAVTVVVPESTTARAKELIRSEGAEVIVHGPSWQEANERAVSLIAEGSYFIHPFDDPLLWDGHATIVDEIVKAGPTVDCFVLAVGGGGLLCGVAAGLDRNGLEKTRIAALETEGTASLNQSLKDDDRITLSSITGVATSLGAKQVCRRAWEIARTGRLRSATVTDPQAIRACLRFLDDHRVLVEPACGAALAAVYDRSPALDGFDTIAVIVCGGNTVTQEMLHRWAESLE